MDRHWSEEARAIVRRAGHNRGAARDALIELLSDQDCALSVAEIETRLGAQRPVARASVYRAVELLHSLHLITRVDIGDGVARYERAAYDHSHHHHLVCDSCGVLIPFEDPGLEQAIDRVGAQLGFATTEHEVTLHGTCVRCN